MEESLKYLPGLLFAAGALIVNPATCRAQAAEPEEVVISASRLPAPASAGIYSISTVSAAQLAGRQSVSDALGHLAEIHVQAPGGRSGVASVFLRGADPNFTAVLLDGVALNDSTNSRGGSVNVAAIDTGALERIEVVAGPMSSLYGSGALAGAINLVVPGGTRNPALQGTVTGGSRSDYSGALRLTGPLVGALGASLALTGSNDGDVSPGSQFKAWSVTGRIAALESVGPGRLILRAQGSDSEAFPDSSGGSRLATRRTLQSLKARETLVGLDQRVLTRGAFTLDLAGSWFDRHEDTNNPGVAPSRFNTSGVPASIDASRYRRGMLQAVARYGQGNWSSAGGVEMQREAGQNSGQLTFFGLRLPTSFDKTRNLASAFVEGGYATRAWMVNAALRADNVDGIGTHITARVGARYLLPLTGLSLRASAGTGFKAPSFYALGNPLVGNPALRPERSESGEAGLVWQRGSGVAASVTFFRARYADLVDFDPGPPPRLVNRSEVISKGVAAALTLPVNNHLTVTAGTQYATTVDDTGTQLLNRPRWRATAGLSWAVTSRLSLDLQGSYLGQRDDYAIPTGVLTLAACSLVSLEGSFTVSPSTRLRLIVDNTLDRTYEDAVGFPAPRIRARLSLTQRL